MGSTYVSPVIARVLSNEGHYGNWYRRRFI